MIRQRKPRIDLIGFKNDQGVVTRTDAPNKWAILCSSCGEEHIQSAREIQRNQKSMSCVNYRPPNYKGINKRDAVVRRVYGITLADYESMLEDQDHSCAICGKTSDEEGQRLAIDHCHSTSKVRGVLCSNCNKALGLFNDNPDLLCNAAEYLSKYKFLREVL